ncbi:MAG: hypothetical protein LBI78_06715, partial [Campylobacteraceae bacterium]|nr:hypothetical protein [Campylobacteraceae bacterium]
MKQIGCLASICRFLLLYKNLSKFFIVLFKNCISILFYQNSQIKKKNIANTLSLVCVEKSIFTKILFLLSVSLFFSTNAYAFNFRCDRLYFASLHHTRVSEINPNVPSEIVLTTDFGQATLAIGPIGPNSPTLRLYRWGYAWHGSGTTTATDYHRRMQYLDSGGTNTWKNLSYSAVTDLSSTKTGWSGGEVNQKTGEIYISGQYDDTIQNDYRMGIIDVANGGTFKHSGRLQPKRPTDSLTGGVVSDMAIDAEGNAYIMVGFGGFWLLKVEVGNNNGGWKYSRVKYISTLGGNNLANNQWGMAFLDGNLYTGDTEGRIYRTNILLNQTTLVGDFTGLTSYGTRDLAACQMAPVIRGKVFIDADGDGKISSTERNADGLANVGIGIYDINKKYLGYVLTDESGEYSLLLPSSKTTFYVRMKQPQISEANVKQTWASGGRFEWRGNIGTKGNNTVTPECYNPFVIHENTTSSTPSGDYKNYYSTECYGARADGIDGTDVNNFALSNFYTQVVMTTDLAVVVADFAIAPVDRSDAPQGTISSKSYNFGKTSHTRTKDAVFLGHNIN